jgi:hypothetical protein
LSSAAIRAATDLAAIRRGCVCAIVPNCPRPALRQNWGNWVVLPDPVSPHTTMQGEITRASSISARADSMGRATPVPIVGIRDRREVASATDFSMCNFTLARPVRATASGRPRSLRNRRSSRRRSAIMQIGTRAFNVSAIVATDSNCRSSDMICCTISGLQFEPRPC